jgi:hypothetical protein
MPVGNPTLNKRLMGFDLLVVYGAARLAWILILRPVQTTSHRANGKAG